VLGKGGKGFGVHAAAAAFFPVVLRLARIWSRRQGNLETAAETHLLTYGAVFTGKAHRNTEEILYSQAQRATLWCVHTYCTYAIRMGWSRTRKPLGGKGRGGPEHSGNAGLFGGQRR
jgi:hypothetical protein